MVKNYRVKENKAWGEQENNKLFPYSTATSTKNNPIPSIEQETKDFRKHSVANTGLYPLFFSLSANYYWILVLKRVENFSQWKTCDRITVYECHRPIFIQKLAICLNEWKRVIFQNTFNWEKTSFRKQFQLIDILTKTTSAWKHL